MNNEWTTWVLAILFIVFGIGLAILGRIQERRRREALKRVAHHMNLEYQAERDSTFPQSFHFLQKMELGSNRYAFCIFRGEYQGFPIQVFDYHYETYSSGRRGRRRTHHHFHHFYILSLPKSFAELNISPEGLVSKMAQIFGYEDIDFESYEFSKKYCVRSKDKKLAYDFCNARMMEYLLTQKDLTIELESNYLCLAFRGKNAAKRVRMNSHRLIQIRKLMPEYLFSESI